jgi:hypothetical protein
MSYLIRDKIVESFRHGIFQSVTPYLFNINCFNITVDTRYAAGVGGQLVHPRYKWKENYLIYRLGGVIIPVAYRRSAVSTSCVLATICNSRVWRMFSIILYLNWYNEPYIVLKGPRVADPCPRTEKFASDKGCKNKWNGI